MTVGELINELQKFNADLDAYVTATHCDCGGRVKKVFKKGKVVVIEDDYTERKRL